MNKAIDDDGIRAIFSNVGGIDQGEKHGCN